MPDEEGHELTKLELFRLERTKMERLLSRMEIYVVETEAGKVSKSIPKADGTELLRKEINYTVDDTDKMKNAFSVGAIARGRNILDTIGRIL